MAKIASALDQKTIRFISNQQIFFVSTAAKGGRVNVSPKGLDSLKVLNDTKLIWLNLTGSGNETAAHILDTNRMTIMFCAFEGKPKILRLYCRATAINPDHELWQECYEYFPNYPGARQIFDVTIEGVQSSCGMAVPRYEYLEDRQELNVSHKKKGTEKIVAYWKEHNMESIDGLPTGLTS